MTALVPSARSRAAAITSHPRRRQAAIASATERAREWGQATTAH
jgi:hypothetical protein